MVKKAQAQHIAEQEESKQYHRFALSPEDIEEQERVARGSSQNVVAKKTDADRARAKARRERGSKHN